MLLINALCSNALQLQCCHACVALYFAWPVTEATLSSRPAWGTEGAVKVDLPQALTFDGNATVECSQCVLSGASRGAGMQVCHWCLLAARPGARSAYEDYPGTYSQERGSQPCLPQSIPAALL